MLWSFVTHELVTEDPSLKAMKFEGAKKYIKSADIHQCYSSCSKRDKMGRQGVLDF
jgi:hypothetical protein